VGHQGCAAELAALLSPHAAATLTASLAAAALAAAAASAALTALTAVAAAALVATASSSTALPPSAFPTASLTTAALISAVAAACAPKHAAALASAAAAAAALPAAPASAAACPWPLHGPGGRRLPQIHRPHESSRDVLARRGGDERAPRRDPVLPLRRGLRGLRLLPPPGGVARHARLAHAGDGRPQPGRCDAAPRGARVRHARRATLHRARALHGDLLRRRLRLRLALCLVFDVLHRPAARAASLAPPATAFAACTAAAPATAAGATRTASAQTARAAATASWPSLTAAAAATAVPTPAAATACIAAAGHS